jgi:hypothetical protein
MKWIALTPGATPLNYFCEWPFIRISRIPLLASAVSLLSAGTSLLIFWRIAEKLQICSSAAVVALFAAAPITFALALTARPAEQGVLTALIAT